MKVHKICPTCSIDYYVPGFIAKVKPINYCSQACRKIATKERNASPLKHSDLTARYNYDSDTGIFTHKKNYGVVEGSTSGYKMDFGHLQIRVGSTLYLAHRLAWFYVYKVWPTRQLDHRDGNPSNNAINNLRESNQAQNMWNMKTPKHNKSGCKGVSWDKSRNLWRATIRADGVWKQLGRFVLLEDAISIRRQAQYTYHGEFARQ